MMFRRHMQDIRQRMDHFEQFGRSKGPQGFERFGGFGRRGGCLLYTSDAADE